MDFPEHVAFNVHKGRTLKINGIRHRVNRREVLVNFFDDVTVLLWLKHQKTREQCVLVALYNSLSQEITLKCYIPAGEVTMLDTEAKLFQCEDAQYKVASNLDVSVWNVQPKGRTIAIYQASHLIKGHLLIVEIDDRLMGLISPVLYHNETISLG